MDLYLHISATGIKNIAVLKIEEQETDKIIKSEGIRQRLQELLYEYYGKPIIIHIAEIEILDANFIEIKVPVTIGDNEQDSWSENIYLNETWLY
jgi:hypothetical protein